MAARSGFQKKRRKRTLTMARTTDIRVPRRMLGIAAATPLRSTVTLSTCYLRTCVHGSENQYWSFVMNNAYDPFATDSSAQPRGFNEMAALYSRYYVTSVKIIIKVYNRHTSEAAHVGFVATAGQEPTDTVPYRIGELPNSVNQIALANQQNVCRFQKSIVIKDIYGAWDVGDFSTVTASNTSPAKKVYGRVFCATADGSGGVDSVFHLCMHQKITFFDRKPLTAKDHA